MAAATSLGRRSDDLVLPYSRCSHFSALNHTTVYLSTCLSIFLSVCLSICLSFLSACLPAVYLSLPCCPSPFLTPHPILAFPFSFLQVWQRCEAALYLQLHQPNDGCPGRGYGAPSGQCRRAPFYRFQDTPRHPGYVQYASTTAFHPFLIGFCFFVHSPGPPLSHTLWPPLMYT